MTRHWIARNISQLNDIRFSTISAEGERTYGRLYLLAGQLDADGLFIENGKQLTEQEIAYRVRLDVATLRKAINELRKMRILHVNGKGPQIADWKHEQRDMTRKRESDRVRQQRHRSVTRDTDVTNGASRSVTSLEESLEETHITIQDILLLLSPVDRQKTKPAWIEEAIAIAEKAGKPASYAKGIIQNWIKEGKRNNAKSKTSHTRRNVKPEAGKADNPPTSSDIEAARRALAKRKAKASV